MTEPAPTPRTMWRIAGALALAHVVLFLLAVAVSGPPTIHPGQEGIEHSWHEGPVAQVMASGYLNVLGFLALLPAFVFLGSVVGRRTAAGHWAAQTATLAGLGFVLVVVGTGFAAGGAALWSRETGLDLETTLALNNIQNFAYLLGLPLLGVFALATGYAAVTERVLTRWVGWGGIGVGIALLLALPAAGVGLTYGMPLWLLWWLGVGISLLRHDPGSAAAAPAAPSSAAEPTAVHH